VARAVSIKRPKLSFAAFADIVFIDHAHPLIWLLWLFLCISAIRTFVRWYRQILEPASATSLSLYCPGQNTSASNCNCRNSSLWCRGPPRASNTTTLRRTLRVPGQGLRSAATSPALDAPVQVRGSCKLSDPLPPHYPDEVQIELEKRGHPVH
jgi:hypothetical protein